MLLKYRPDIDGLRAIAVLAVILFHTGVPGFSGGFVGVDIFFVISGFLITSIILKEIKKENFSIARFYERRIRRIFPALFPVIAFTLIVGTYLFDAVAFKEFGESVTATTLFSSNILFWHQAGYFDAPSLQKPLLHTWSLAVEEQFYIFFPLALMFIHKYLKSHYLLWVFITITLSLVTSIFGVYKYPIETFYLVPPRAWELLVGSVLALGVLPIPSSLWLRNLLSITGFGFIVYSVGFYTEATLFPGQGAIAPVFGAWLIIYSNKVGDEMAVVNKALSLRPLVFIGLISYSLYLWHWPLVVFTKYLTFHPFNGYERAGIIFASLAVSTLSWKYIEQPFRSKQMLLPERKRLFDMAGVVMIVASGIGVFIYFQNGMSNRFGLSETKMAIPSNDIMPPILIGKKDAAPSFVLWGDSHAASLTPAIIEQANKNNLSGFVFAHGSTPALLGIESNLDKPDFSKAEWNSKVLDFIKRKPTIKVVFLAAQWSNYNLLNRNGLVFHDISNGFIKKGDGNAYLIEGLNRTISALHGMGRKVVFVADVPSFDYPVPKIHALHYRFPYYVNLNQFLPEIGHHNKSQEEVIRRLINLSEIECIYPSSKIFDKDGKCRITANSKLLYQDSNHLSIAGALYIAPVFDVVFKEMEVGAKIDNIKMISPK